MLQPPPPPKKKKVFAPVPSEPQRTSSMDVQKVALRRFSLSSVIHERYVSCSTIHRAPRPPIALMTMTMRTRRRTRRSRRSQRKRRENVAAHRNHQSQRLQLWRSRKLNGLVFFSYNMWPTNAHRLTGFRGRSEGAQEETKGCCSISSTGLY